MPGFPTRRLGLASLVLLVALLGAAGAVAIARPDGAVPPRPEDVFGFAVGADFKLADYA